jgi:hypothetical protein
VDKAFGLAEAALCALGFRITQRTNETLELIGPGMNSSRESALLGASGIRIHCGDSQLTLEADLGAVARMERFVLFFPVGLCVVLGVAIP